MNTIRFSRKTDLGQQKLALKSKYDLIIRIAFQLVQDNEKIKEEKLESLKKNYYEVADKNIEKNEISMNVFII